MAPPSAPTEKKASSAVWARVAALRKGGKTQVRYAPPTEAEATVYRQWLAAAARAAGHAGAPPPAPRGFQLEQHENGALWLLCERPDRRRGAGAVLLRVGPAQPLIVEAPHTFFDEGTLGLSRHQFERSKARALVLNTAHRGNRARGMEQAALEQASRSGALASDVAHAERSFFQQAHAALVGTAPRPAVVQLHGYRDGHVPAEAVVSAAGGSFDVAPLVERLRRLLPLAGIAQYGRDTDALGGTTNVQAKYAKAQEVPFVHLELSHTLRRRLEEETSLRNQVLDALVAALAD